MVKYILRFCLLLSVHTAIAQSNPDTLKLMTYNTNNYGFPSSSDCPLLLSENQHQHLRTILKYVNPDIIDLQKMDASPTTFCTNTVMTHVFDSVCAGCYAHTPYTNNSGYTKVNMLYYKTAKLAWLSTTTIYSGDNSISDINLHKLYYKSADLAATHDTVFLNVIDVHDLSGSSSKNAKERGTEIAGAVSWLSNHVTEPGNYIFMGDLNTQSSSESCFQDLINNANSNIRFYDPPGLLGNWAADPDSFAVYLTQSTRSSDIGDCGSDNAMNFRFDHILCTSPVMNGTQKIKYIPNSYTVIGQDGKHTGGALTDSPTDMAAPGNIISALYNMSEHLPVSVLLEIAPTLINSNQSVNTGGRIKIFPNPANDFINVTVNTMPEESYHVSVVNILGQVLWQGEIKQSSSGLHVPVATFQKGFYLLRLTGNNTAFTCSFVK